MLDIVIRLSNTLVLNESDRSQVKIKIKKLYLKSLILNKQNKLCRALLQDNNILLTDTYLPYSFSLAQPILCERQQGSC